MSEETHVKDLLALFVLGNLEDEQAALVSEHVQVCPECEEELLISEQVLNGILLSSPRSAPPKESKKRLMAHLRRPGRGEDTSSTKGSWRESLRKIAPRRLGPILVPAGLALIFILVVIDLSFSYGLHRQELLPTQQVPHSPYVVELKGTERMPNARGLILISNDGRQAILITEGLDPLEDFAYQLWLNRHEQYTNAGQFTIADRGRNAVELVVPDTFFIYRGFEITIEPKGGSDKPTGERVMDGIFDVLESFNSPANQ